MPYEWGDTTFQVGTKSGTYRFQRISTTGCDSIFRLVLTVHQPFDTTVYDTICADALPYEWGDTTFQVGTESGTYRFQRISAVTGCDSIVNLNLTVLQPFDTTVYDTVCQGDAYDKYGLSLSNVQEDNVYTLSFLSQAGCDTTVFLHLKVWQTYDTTVYDTICQGEPYYQHGQNLASATESFTGTRTLQTVHGCDSIVTLHLTVSPKYLFPESRDICAGEFTEFRGKLLYESGTYDDLLLTVHGCDSIYRLTLNVHPVYAVSLTDILCEGVPYTRYGFNVSEPGTHVLRLNTIHGCDSVVTLELAEEKKVRGGIVLSLEDCETHGYAFFFEPDSARGDWRWDMGDGSTYRTQEGYHAYADSGTYRVTLQLETPGGCGNEYAREQRVPHYAREVSIRANRMVIDAETPSVRFRAEAPAGMVCRWEFGDGATAEGAETEHVYDATSARYYDAVLRVFNADSCVTEDAVRIEVLPLPKEVNTFSPNGDGINDVFMPEFRVEIINRNGLRIYAGDHGWDGTCRTGDAKEDTYFYKLYYRTANGNRVKTGFVMLVR